MVGCSFLVFSLQENNCCLLQWVLKLLQVSDGVIQGKLVCLILKKDVCIEEVQQYGDMLFLQVVDIVLCFEDVFIDLFGGVGIVELLLGVIIYCVDGSKEEMVIEVQLLMKKFGDFVVIDYVDFQVKCGEIFGLFGFNGVGKFIIFKMMCGLLVFIFGKVLVLGMDFKVSFGKVCQYLGYMV